MTFADSGAGAREDLLTDYRALTSEAGWVDLAERTQIRLTGRDRATFLNNLCTNNIRSLEAGQGQEAFVLDVQGHVIGIINAFCLEESLDVDTQSGQAERLLKHFERYLIREQVEISDLTGQWEEIVLAGPLVEAILSGWGGKLPAVRLAHLPLAKFGGSTRVRRIDWTACETVLIAGEKQELAAVRAALHRGGTRRCGAATLEAARIEQGIPWFGQDTNEKTLPQELRRDALAISFTKGCYLGQETVARIDALGHVNRFLVGLRCSGEVQPEPGASVLHNATQVGRVTSAAWSPRLEAAIALATLKRGYETPGTVLQIGEQGATVVELPVR